MSMEKLQKEKLELDIAEAKRKRDQRWFQRPEWWQGSMTPVAVAILGLGVVFLPRYFDSRFDEQDEKIAKLRQDNVSLRESQKSHLGHAIELVKDYGGSIEIGRLGTTEITLHGWRGVNKSIHFVEDRTLPPKMITKELVSAIGSFSSLAKLEIYAHEIPPGVFDEIGAMSNMFDLTIHHTNLTDAHLASLVQWQSLQKLDISDTRVTDGCTSSLLQFPKLRHLRIAGTQMTDEALVDLGGLTRLQHLVVPTSCSDDAIDRLKKKLPKCEISRAGPYD